MTSTRPSLLLPQMALGLALGALLAGCGAPPPSAPDAPGASFSSSPAASTPHSAPGSAADIDCGAIPIDDLSGMLHEFGIPPATVTAEADGCMVAAGEARYRITVSAETVDEVVAGRPGERMGGAPAVLLQGDRVWIQDCGDRTCIVTVIGGPEPVDLSTLIVIAPALASIFTR